MMKMKTQLLIMLLCSICLLAGCKTTHSSEHGTPNTTALENPIFAGVDVDSATLTAVWERDGGKCVDCGGMKNLGYAHKMSPDEGGSNDADNLELRCKSCYAGN